MSRIALIGVTALIVLLVGAGVVFAQSSTVGGRGMMNFAQIPGTPGTETTPGTGTYGPGMMGNTNGTYGPGMMGNGEGYGPGMMGNIDWNAMRDAMNSGNWEQALQVCQSAAAANAANANSQGTDPGTDPGNGPGTNNNTSTGPTAGASSPTAGVSAGTSTGSTTGTTYGPGMMGSGSSGMMGSRI